MPTKKSTSKSNKWIYSADEQIFHLMFDEHAAIMLLIEPESGIILDANQAAVDFYGYPKPKLRGMSINRINTLPPEQVATERLKALTKKQNFFIFTHRVASGEERIVEVHSTSITLQGRKILFSIIHDITERRQFEEKQNESENRLREVLENSLDASYKRNLKNNTYDYLSPVFEQITGYTPDEMKRLPTENVLGLMHPDDMPEIERVIAMSMSDDNGTAYRVDYRFKHKDGEYRWLHDQFIVVRDKQGQPAARIGSVSDITLRKRAEESLWESENKFRGFIAQSTEGMALVDTQGVIVEWNYACEQITGIPRTETIGHFAWEIQARLEPQKKRGLWTPDRTHAYITQLLNNPQSPGQDKSTEATIHTPSGEEKIVLQNLFPIQHGQRHYIGITLRDITEKKQKNEELRLFKTIIEESDEAIAISDRSGALVYINPAHKKLFGYSLEEARLLNYRDYYPTESVDILNRIVSPTLERGESWEGVLEAIDRTGQRFPLWERAGQIFDSDGNMLYGFGFMHNFAERIQMEERLRQTNWRLESILEGTHAGTWEWNIQTGETVFNETWAEIVGYTLEELSPISIKTWEMLTHPDDLRQFNELLKQHFTGELPYYNFEYRMKHKNGTWIWVIDRGRIITRTSDGHPLMIFGTHIDITERKQAEEELRKSEQRLQLALSGAEMGMWTLNVITMQGSVDERAAQILGYAQADIPNEKISWDEMTHPDDIPRIGKILAAHLNGQSPIFESEHRMRHASGEYRWVNGRGKVTQFNKDGSPLQISGTMTDITEHKVAESIQQIQLKLSQFADVHSLDELIQKALDEVEALIGGQIGFVHFLEADQKTLQLQMWSSNTLKNMCTASGKGQHYSIESAGVWADCVAARKPVIHNDYRSLSHRKGLPEGHAPILRELLIPVLRQELVVMIMGIGNKLTEFTSMDIEIASQLASYLWDIVQRKRAEAALKQSEMQYHLLADHMTDIIWLRDLNLNLLYISPSEEKIRGHTLAELQQMPLEDLLTPDSVQLAMELFANEIPKILADRTYSPTLTAEFDFYLPNGDLHSVESKISIIRDENGNPTSILGQDRDITDRKLAERALEVANTELKNALNRERQLARTDSLTGINNRRFLYEQANHEIGVARRYHHPLSIIMFDIDHFKIVNDTFGHEMGDNILRLISETACAQLRSADVIGRYGGEEFVILLPMTNVHQAYLLAERIRTSVELLRTPSENGDVSTTISIGIAEMSPAAPTESVENLFRLADKAMYRAKQTGRNRTVVFDSK